MAGPFPFPTTGPSIITAVNSGSDSDNEKELMGRRMKHEEAAEPS
jgi:hypothetical protein